MSSTQTDIAPLSLRPKRADAARNFDKLIAAAREAFTEAGNDASLEDIARRAGVGIGTLYRNFPNRQALLEAVYLEEVDAICNNAGDLSDLEPWEALTTWLRHYAGYAATKKALFSELSQYLEEGAPTFMHCRTHILVAGEPLLQAAQDAGVVRTDVEFMDIAKMVGSVASIVADDEQKARILDVSLDGLRCRD